MFLSLGFLQADDIGGLGYHPGEKALRGGGADAVDINGDDSHGALLECCDELAVVIGLCSAAAWFYNTCPPSNRHIMQDYQREFIDFAIGIGALRFGQFTLKSGRISPYFFNSGLFNSGGSLARLGMCYAAAIQHSGVEYDLLFGPAYKGIPLAAATAIALAQQHGRDVPYAFNRKEAKDHGEGGVTVGAKLAGRILIIDDVITAGTSVGESVAIIASAGATPAGVVIALNRQERGMGERSAIAEVEENYGVGVISIIDLDSLIEYLTARPDSDSELKAIMGYRMAYGVGL